MPKTTAAATSRISPLSLLDIVERSLIDKGGLKSRATFVIDGKPTPASRPRVSKFGTYYGKTYKTWRKIADECLSKTSELVTDDVVVLIDVVVPRPKTTKRSTPSGDVDNYAKGPLDAITKNESYWHDDDQVVLMIVGKRYSDTADEVGGRVTVKVLQ